VSQTQDLSIIGLTPYFYTTKPSSLVSCSSGSNHSNTCCSFSKLEIPSSPSGKSLTRQRKRHRGRKSEDILRDGTVDTEVVFKTELLTAATTATTITTTTTTSSPRGQQSSPRRLGQRKCSRTSVADAEDDKIQRCESKRKRKRRTSKDTILLQTELVSLSTILVLSRVIQKT